MTWFEDRIEAGERLILDGAIGTELQRRGLAMDDDAWCARANLDDPDTVRALHADYIDAGADIITANTFSTHRYVLEPAGLADRFETINRRAVALAREARDDAGGRAIAIAGSMSHMPALTFRHERPDAAKAAATYRELADILADAGCELLIAEMMMSPGHAEAVVEAAARTGLPVWVGFSVRVADDDRVMMLYDDSAVENSPNGRTPLADFAPGVLARGGTVAGIMHSDVEETEPGLNALAAVWDGPLLAYPHSGDWSPPNWGFDTVIDPQAYARAAAGWVEQHNVQVVGGCCGIGPDHIRALCERLSLVRNPG